jgi:hypothetical protein
MDSSKRKVMRSFKSTADHDVGHARLSPNMAWESASIRAACKSWRIMLDHCRGQLRVCALVGRYGG